MADGVWKSIYPQIFGSSRQLSLNKFFDPSTPSIRKGRDREWKKMGVGMTVATNGVASRPRKCQPTGTPTARANYKYL